jgi:hypothetical protein
MSFSCDLCGMFFETDEALETHQLKYCQGSAMHKAMIATQEEHAGVLAGVLEEDALLALSSQLTALGDGVEQLNVGELRERVTAEAAERRAQRETHKAAADRAADRMAQQRAKTEIQKQMVEAQLEAQRVVELQAKVQLRAAERLAEEKMLRERAKHQQAQLEDLERQRHELGKARADSPASRAERTRRMRAEPISSIPLTLCAPRP